MAAAGTTYGEDDLPLVDYVFRCVHCHALLDPATADEREPKALEVTT